MPITSKTPKKAIEQIIQRRINYLIQRMIETLCYVGEEVIKYARDPDRRRYIDRTGNLTSSIGYVVLNEGEVVVESSFKPVAASELKRDKKDATPIDGLTGSAEGEAFLNKLKSENPTGLALIVVAGMPYAKLVEAKGFDVLESAELETEENVKRALKKLMGPKKK